MIAVDASAILAIFLREDDADLYAETLAQARQGAISSVNYWEVLVTAQLLRGPAGRDIIARLLVLLNVGIATVDANSADTAARAFERFRGRPGGRLNLGDCFAYALAEHEGDGLLFKGDDFPKTDVKDALA